MKKYPFQELPGLNNIEAEGQETIKLPTGEVYEVKGNSHANGGVKLFAPSGSKVFSKTLKLSEEDVSKILGKPSKSMSPAELSKKFRTDKYIDIIEDRTGKYDNLSKKTAELMLEKNTKAQEVIFSAQEAMKESGVNKNNYKKGGKVKYQAGGTAYTWDQMQEILNKKQQPAVSQPRFGIQGSNYAPAPDPNMSFSVSNLDAPQQPMIGQTSIDDQLSDAFRTVYRSTYNPYAQDEFFTSGYATNKSGYDPKSPILKRRQEQLTEVINYEGNDPLYQELRKDYTKYLKEVDAKDPDKFLKKEVEVNGNLIPLSQATPEQIENSTRTVVTNLRTGQRSLVDQREGNRGEGTSNQLWNPSITRTSSEFNPLTPINTLPREVKSQGKITPESQPEVQPDLEPYPYGEPEGEPVGIDPQKLINGLQAGLLIGDLATLQKANPYYTFRPTQMAYQRFEPLNTKQQERAFNLAKESLENSNLPESVKQAQLAQIQANMARGINEIDSRNYQGNLAVQNANTSSLINAVNNDEQRRQEANLRYLQDEARGEYLYRSQRQVFRDQLFKLWREHAQNVSEQKLINQLSRNYNFNPNTQQVEYQPGQGVPSMYNNLSPFQQIQAQIQAQQLLNNKQ